MTLKKSADQVLEQSYQAYRVRLFRYCLARLDGAQEAADDCVQEAFLVFYRKLRNGETFTHPQAFLYRTADQFVKRQRQRQQIAARKEVSLTDVEDLKSELDPFQERLAAIDFDALASSLLRTLTAEEQTLYRLRYIEKQQVETIASALQISRPAASMRLTRLRNKIMTLVSQFDFEQEGV